MIKLIVIMEDYKEKYEMALERAKKFIEENPLVQNLNTWIKETFPELKESEDEEIRKELIAWLQNTEGQVLPIDRYYAALAWLEKQSEKKSDWSEEDEEMKINSIEVNIKIKYETTYIHGVQHYTSSNRNFFINEEKYEQILKILEE